MRLEGEIRAPFTQKKKTRCTDESAYRVLQALQVGITSFKPHYWGNLFPSSIAGAISFKHPRMRGEWSKLHRWDFPIEASPQARRIPSPMTGANADLVVDTSKADKRNLPECTALKQRRWIAGTNFLQINASLMSALRQRIGYGSEDYMHSSHAWNPTISLHRLRTFHETHNAR